MHIPSSSVLYTFSAAAGTIVSSTFTHLEDLKLIVNLTDNVVLYNPMAPATGGTLSGTTLTLTYDTSSMSDSDMLQIYYDDAAAIPPADVYQGGSAVAVGNPLEVKLPTATVTTLTPPSAITGFSTATKQDSQIALETTLETLVDTLQELIQRLAPLGGAIANVGGSALRTQGVGTFAVSGPQTSANFIASHNIAGVNYPEKVALTNLTAVQSNVANCTGG